MLRRGFNILAPGSNGGPPTLPDSTNPDRRRESGVRYRGNPCSGRDDGRAKQARERLAASCHSQRQTRSDSRNPMWARVHLGLTVDGMASSAPHDGVKTRRSGATRSPSRMGGNWLTWPGTPSQAFLG